MPVLVESNKATATARNTGSNQQVLEGPVIKYALATTEQEFATVAAAKTLATWKTDVALRKSSLFLNWKSWLLEIQPTPNSKETKATSLLLVKKLELSI
mgnify:CR=1 FL=1